MSPWAQLICFGCRRQKKNKNTLNKTLTNKSSNEWWQQMLHVNRAFMSIFLWSFMTVTTMFKVSLAQTNQQATASHITSQTISKHICSFRVRFAGIRKKTTIADVGKLYRQISSVHIGNARNIKEPQCTSVNNRFAKKKMWIERQPYKYYENISKTKQEAMLQQRATYRETLNAQRIYDTLLMLSCHKWELKKYSASEPARVYWFCNFSQYHKEKRKKH